MQVAPAKLVLAAIHALAILSFKCAPGVTPGTTTLPPGTDIQAAVDSHGSGTTFYLQAGTYAQQSITPKSGDKFLGAPGATLDGQHTTTYAFQGSASNVTIQGLIIQNYNPPAQMGAV